MAAPLVRDASPDDARAIAETRARSWASAYDHVFPPEALEALREESELGRATAWWRQRIEQPAANLHVLVASRAGDVLGFASVGQVAEEGTESDDVGELYTIYVRPEAWGDGIGRALMSEALARLRGEGLREAILWVLEDNPRTRRFYELSGWSADGGVKEEEWLGAVISEVRYRIALDA